MCPISPQSDGNNGGGVGQQRGGREAAATDAIRVQSNRRRASVVVLRKLSSVLLVSPFLLPAAFVLLSWRFADGFPVHQRSVAVGGRRIGLQSQTNWLGDHAASHREGLSFSFSTARTTTGNGKANTQQHPLRSHLAAQQQPRPRTLLASSSGPSNNNNEVGGEGGMILQRDAFNAGDLLASAFSALDEEDKYDAVLTGICAKILDNPKEAEEQIAAERAAAGGGDGGGEMLGVLEKPLELLQEMNRRRVDASPRSVSALIDTAATTENVRLMNMALSMSIQNGAISQFGSLQTDLNPFPGSDRAGRRQIDALSDVPSDDRVGEIGSALSFMGVVAACLFVKWFGGDGGPTDVSSFLTGLIPDATLWSLAIVGIVDNFYDVVQSSSKLVDAIPNDTLPSKDKLPLGLGRGEWTKGVVGGLNRLLTVDTERECQSEAAAFFAAYSLGLPCFAFQPNALEAAVMVFESMKKDGNGNGIGGGGGSLGAIFRSSTLNPMLSDAGVLKALVWLLAPVAMENMKHPQLIASDPREASGLLQRLQDKAEAMGTTKEVEDLNLMDEGEREDLLKWAFAEANTLVRGNMKVCEELAEGLAGGASTVGDCVAVMEDW